MIAKCRFHKWDRHFCLRENYLAFSCLAVVFKTFWQVFSSLWTLPKNPIARVVYDSRPICHGKDIHCPFGDFGKRGVAAGLARYRLILNDDS
jgi:hypothetical protein